MALEHADRFDGQCWSRHEAARVRIGNLQPGPEVIDVHLGIAHALAFLSKAAFESNDAALNQFAGLLVAMIAVGISDGVGEVGGFLRVVTVNFDFDQNGIIDKILTYDVDGKDKPVFLKHDLEDAMPILKKNSFRHAEYAKKSVEELVGSDKLKNALTKQFNYPSSCVAINNGNGQFIIQKLPVMVQMSSVNAIHCMDINADGFIDLVMGGNQFDFQPQLERLDASSGDVLVNDGHGNFKWVEPARTGLNLKGQLRDIEEVRVGSRRNLLFLQNDEYPTFYELNNYLVGETDHPLHK